MLIAAVMVVTTAPAAAAAPQGKSSRATPVIFIHGQSGSAQQFETTAMRLTSNGFPQNRIFAFEYNTLDSSNDVAITDLDGFIAQVKARTGVAKVDILAHSRGTTVMHQYLSTPARAASVRRYVNFDGRTSDTPPGGVPTLAIWGEGLQTRAIGGAVNEYFPDKAHTEVTTSAEAFAEVYRFLTGHRARTTQVVPEKPDRVTVKGRALDFPDNTGIAGGTLRVYRLDSETGQRARRKPVYRQALDATGDFGPIKVNGRRHYEFEVTQLDSVKVHNYPEPFERDDHFYRVLSAPLLNPFIARDRESVALTVTRMREFWADQPAPDANDRLTLDGVDLLNPATAPRARRVLAVFTFDQGADGATDTTVSQAPFGSISFLTGVDVFTAASPDASGTVTVTEDMREPRGHRETINVADWPSDAHSVSVFFKDYDARAYKRKRRKP